MPKRPCWHFYPADWRGDVALRSCSEGARLLWFELCMIMHDCTHRGALLVNERQPTPEQIARMTSTDPTQVEARLAELEANGVFNRSTKGTIYSRRMVRETRRINAGRTNGALGGNPVLTKRELSASEQTQIPGLVNPQVNPQGQTAPQIDFPESQDTPWGVPLTHCNSTEIRPSVNPYTNTIRKESCTGSRVQTSDGGVLPEGGGRKGGVGGNLDLPGAGAPSSAIADPHPDEEPDRFDDGPEPISEAQLADCELVAALWNRICGDVLPSVRKLDQNRLRAVRRRLIEDCRGDLAVAEHYFKRIRASDFCCGQNDREWIATFDWAMKPRTWLKVSEGTFDNRARQSKARRGYSGVDLHHRAMARLAAAGELDDDDGDQLPCKPSQVNYEH